MRREAEGARGYIGKEELVPEQHSVPSAWGTLERVRAGNAEGCE